MRFFFLVAAVIVAVPAMSQTASLSPTGWPELPSAATSFGAAVVPGDDGSREVYIYGGHVGNAHSYSTSEQTGDFHRLSVDPDGNADDWQSLAGGPKLQGHALVSDGQSVIRVGGFTARNAEGEDQDLHSSAGAARFDPATGEWSPLPDMPDGRSSIDAAIMDGFLYVIGGWKLAGDPGDAIWHEDAIRLSLNDLDAGWETIAPPGFKRRAISVAAHDGKLYVVGGMQPGAGPVGTVAVYDPASNAWSDGPTVPGEAMAGFGSSSFATGGRLYTTTMDGHLYEISGDGTSWNDRMTYEPARLFHRMLPWGDDALILVGGINMQIGPFETIDKIKLK